MQLFAPAKINLSFKILRRREDGFHEIETLMAPISLGDELTIEPNDSGSGIAFSTDDPTLPAGEDNLVVRAARSFFAEINEEPGVRIRLQKKIPHGAGLGGGSSDAASTLLGLNQLHEGGVSPARLTNLAAALGSDVPFFLAQSAARCRGRGEIVEAVERLPALSLLLLKPEFGVSDAVGLFALARIAGVAGGGLRAAARWESWFSRTISSARFSRSIFFWRA